MTLFAITAWSIYIGSTRETLPEEDPNTTENKDMDLYTRMIARVRSGQGYYDALHAEFEQMNYDVHSLFNYRTPTYAWLYALFPNLEWGRWAQLALAFATLVLCYRVMWREDAKIKGIIAVALAAGSLSWSLIDRFSLFTEVWAGALITFSIASHALGMRSIGVLTGLLALFYRELAFPYCAVACGLALWESRRREVLAWLVGFALYALYFFYHSQHVLPRLHTGNSGVNFSRWVQFNGLQFLLATERTNLLLLLAPPWLVAMCLTLGLLGLAGWKSEMGRRSALTLAMYFPVFAAVGGIANFYWGLLYSPLLAIGLVWAPAALRDLLRCLLQSRVAICQPMLTVRQGSVPSLESRQELMLR
jgi:hypothetical protein